MLKIGMIGAGFVAGFHERALCSVREVEFAGVCAPVGAEALAARARQDGLGDTEVFKSIADLCGTVDVVCIFAPNFARIDIMRKIAKAIENTSTTGKKIRVEMRDSLSQAVKSADSLAGKGDIVLFSPGCASYDMFDNFQQRGQAFIDLVNRLS